MSDVAERAGAELRTIRCAAPLPPTITDWVRRREYQIGAEALGWEWDRGVPPADVPDALRRLGVALIERAVKVHGRRPGD
jgi:hypothetical protein